MQTKLIAATRAAAAEAACALTNEVGYTHEHRKTAADRPVAQRPSRAEPVAPRYTFGVLRTRVDKLGRAVQILRAFDRATYRTLHRSAVRRSSGRYPR